MSQQEMRMTGSGTAAIPPQPVPGGNDTEVVDTRFGQVTVYRKNPVIFPNGMLGMPDKFEYCLTKLPSDKLARFKLLQSLDDLSLSFITLPVEITNSIIDKEDILAGCKDLEIRPEDLSLLLVVTVHRLPNAVRLSVNARAPIFINTPKRVATQYVFRNSKYEIQHMISM